MTSDELRELERTRRRALWALASLHPGDPEASDRLAILDHLDDQQQSETPSTDTPMGLKEVRDSVPVQHHRCGIDIVLEHDIPQPWRERFLQASIGSPGLRMGSTPQTGIDSCPVGQPRCGIWKPTGRRGATQGLTNRSEGLHGTTW